MEQTKPVKNVQLKDDSNDIYSNLLTIKTVSVPQVLRRGEVSGDLMLFAKFFALDTKEKADAFAAEFSENPIGKELILMYNEAVRDVTVLEKLENNEYFSSRLSEEDAVVISDRRAVDTAKSLLLEGVNTDIIAKCTKLPLETVKRLAAR
jgi:hypothetical protein